MCEGSQGALEIYSFLLSSATDTRHTVPLTPNLLVWKETEGDRNLQVATEVDDPKHIIS